MFSTILFLMVVSLLLALPAALRKGSGNRLLRVTGLTFAGVTLPLLAFFGGAFVVPEWKGGCLYGWIDCFHLGKLALTPFVLAATFALYCLDIWGTKDRTQPWIFRCMLAGAVVASVCFVFGMATVRSGQWIVMVPGYTATWYVARTWQLAKEVKLHPLDYAASLGSTVPFWIGSVIWSQKTFEALPDQAPSCFVVTAAGKGHKTLVGPFAAIVRHGRPVLANQQLLTFWRLEALWREISPKGHGAFRWVYNRIGPRVARRIRSPWLADLAYLALKPAELIAGAIILLAGKSNTNNWPLHPQTRTKA